MTSIPVDLLRAEHSRIDRWFAAIYNPAFRRSISMPVTIILAFVVSWTVQSVRVAIVDGQLAQEQTSYRALQAQEEQASIQRANYELLLSMVSGIARLQHSIVDRAQEIKDIVNVTNRHHLAVTKLEDLQAREGNATWSLQGQVFDQSLKDSCHEVVASSLLAFLSVQNVTEAIPQHNPRQIDRATAHDSAECDFDLRLARND
jgi:hypothetical protein